MQTILVGLGAIVAGVGGIVVLYWILNAVVEKLPAVWEERLKPYVFIGPPLVLLGVFLMWPAVRTIYLSFFDARAANFIGVDNYVRMFTTGRYLESLLNSIIWILIVPTLSVILGLFVAVLADRLKPTAERVAKSVIFMPMAIALVAAGTTFMFIYAWAPGGGDQYGLLNAIWTGLGGEPQRWLSIDSGRLNTFLLTFVLVWMQAGFAMVLLSAAIKNVPEDTLEAARIDGATELQIFFRVVVPQIATTIMVLLTTITIFVLKTFDVVWVTTGGRFGTEFLPVTFFRELVVVRDQGMAATVIVVILVATIPIMLYNVRQYRKQEGMV
jgi:alpha-glucoside transport system permease protein